MAGAAAYRGRFAPSPTGPLHAGSLVAALASWLDARAHGGQWLVRMEDVDTTRCLPGVEQLILQQLAALGLHSDFPPVYQTHHTTRYQDALDRLVERSLAYPCACARQDIETALLHSGQTKPRHGELIYPGTCRHGLHGKPARAWRVRSDSYIQNKPLAQTGIAQPAIHSIVNNAPSVATQSAPTVMWTDRRLGPQQQNVPAEVGDFVLKRADGCFAYQLAVVVDDADQGITDVVRGEDLADNTARQILLQHVLGLPTPHYLHTPLVLGVNGEKLSKQNGAQALDTSQPLDALNEAAAALGLSPAYKLKDALTGWITLWRNRWAIRA